MSWLKRRNAWWMALREPTTTEGRGEVEARGDKGAADCIGSPAAPRSIVLMLQQLIKVIQVGLVACSAQREARRS